MCTAKDKPAQLQLLSCCEVPGNSCQGCRWKLVKREGWYMQVLGAAKRLHVQLLVVLLVLMLLLLLLSGWG